MIHLVRDVLDTQVLDRHRRPMGKVDGLVLELRAGEPPRVACLEIDPVIAWQRLGPRFGRWARAVARFWRREEDPFRVRWSQVASLEVDIEIDADAEQTSTFELERWLRERVIKHIPGAK